MADLIPFIAVAVGVWFAHYLGKRAYRLGHTGSHRRH
jgi:hypothetical protein